MSKLSVGYQKWMFISFQDCRFIQIESKATISFPGQVTTPIINASPPELLCVLESFQVIPHLKMCYQKSGQKYFKSHRISLRKKAWEALLKQNSNKKNCILLYKLIKSSLTFFQTNIIPRTKFLEKSTFACQQQNRCVIKLLIYYNKI